MQINYRFQSKLWKYEETAGWYFVSLPRRLSTTIRNIHKTEEQGWGRLNVTAQVGNSQWKTSIWFDTRQKCYLLPVKSVIRQKEHLEENKIVACSISV